MCSVLHEIHSQLTCYEWHNSGINVASHIPWEAHRSWRHSLWKCLIVAASTVLNDELLSSLVLGYTLHKVQQIGCLWLCLFLAWHGSFFSLSSWKQEPETNFIFFKINYIKHLYYCFTRSMFNYVYPHFHPSLFSFSFFSFWSFILDSGSAYAD